MKFFSINKSQVASIITLLVVISLGASYFFIYVPSNERVVQEQRFRSLQNIDKNIHTKIDNSIGMLNLLIQAYHEAPGAKKNIRDYIAGYPDENFRLSQPVLLAGEPPKSLDSLDFYTTRVNATGNISLVSQNTIVEPPADTLVYQMAMGFNIEQFIRQMLPASVFDEYIVFSKEAVIYETFPSGISHIINDSLLSAGEGLSGSTMRDYKVSGNDYKLFLQPVNIGNNEWVVGGLLTGKRYNTEKNKLPAPVILLLVTVVLLIILFFPWIKLYQMGSKDRLTLNDAVATVGISMLLMSLLFFMFFKYNVPFRIINAPKEKSRLANSIVNAFKKETDTAYSRIRHFDDLVDSAAFDINNLGKKAIQSKGKNRGGSLGRIDGIVNQFPIKQVYWLNPDGDEVINWNTDTVNAPHGNFKKRPYFKSIREGHHYLLHDSVLMPYYLDQVVSRTSGAFTTVISIPSRYRTTDLPGHVAGMSFIVKSLQDIVLPTGFQYAIIDKEGKVLYHSEITRSLNENLLNEFSNSDPLKALMEARAEGFFNTGYYSEKFYVYARPIKDLPYFIVITENAGYKETRDMEVYSFTFCCMLLFFGFMFFQIIVTFIVSSKQSFFKKQFYNTSWVGPKVSAQRQYNLSIVANITIIILLLVFYMYASFLLYIFLLLFSVTFLSLFLNAVFAKRYRLYRPTNYRYKRNSISWLLVCVVFIDVAALIMLDWPNTMLLLLFEVIAFGIGALLFFKGDNLLDEEPPRDSGTLVHKWNYVHSFTLMVFLRLVVSSGIPVMFFYVTGYNYEQNLDIRYKQVQFAKKLINKLEPEALDNIHNGLDFQSGVYFDSTWMKSAELVPASALKNFSRQYSREDERAVRFLNLFRLHLTDNSIRNDRFYWENAGDSTFFHNHLLKAAEHLDSGSITAIKTKRPGQYLKLTSADLNYHFPTIICSDPYCKGLLYWLFFISVLTLFYVVLFNVIKKIFTLNIPDLTRWKALDDEILVNIKLNNLVFIIGLPGSGKLSRVLEKIQQQAIVGKNGEPYKFIKDNDAESDVFIADLMNIPDEGDLSEQNTDWQLYGAKILDPRYRLVIINHFEYNIQDGSTTRIKLNLLERIMEQNSCRVIILSTIHPVAFLDSVFDQTIKINKPPVPGQDLERWHVLLGHYRIVVFPLEEQVDVLNRDRFEELIIRETSRTHFLNKMQEVAIKVATSMPDRYGIDRDADELAFKLQMTAHYFYMYIWQSLTKEEKFLLYDHAEDNLVNSFDDYNLNMLICKGLLLRRDGSLKIFNNGFRNFILTAIGNVEAMKIKNQIKDNGNWNRLKNPMLIILLAIMVFLVVSQQEAYSRLITYAAALAAGIPAIMKLFSIFESSKEEQN